MTSHSRISPEYSAQALSAPPNPMVAEVISRVTEHFRRARLSIADQGCGKLRHFRQLSRNAHTLVLVDTPAQLAAPHIDRGSSYQIEAWAKKEGRRRGIVVHVMTDKDFERSRLMLEVVVSVAVFDCVLPIVRQRMIVSAHNNLRRGGILAIVIPRNDISILSRCNHENEYFDGYRFQHHGISTFFKNFRQTGPLLRLFKRAGFSLVEDLSRYRHVCLLLEKGGRTSDNLRPSHGAAAASVSLPNRSSRVGEGRSLRRSVGSPYGSAGAVAEPWRS
jgi:hypothetical protein